MKFSLYYEYLYIYIFMDFTGEFYINYCRNWQACDVYLLYMYIVGGVSYLIAFIFMPNLKCLLRW